METWYQHPNGDGWTEDSFTKSFRTLAEPVDGLGDKAFYNVKNRLADGGK
ncbi:hypothetical protein [Krasilnikovia cinnamomea]|nr:hypothetical protein [Krasilnikovia cinnamomea]